MEPDPAALKMEADLHRSNEQCEKLSMSLKQSEVDIKKRDDEINQQLSKVIVFSNMAGIFCSLRANSSSGNPIFVVARGATG